MLYTIVCVEGGTQGRISSIYDKNSQLKNLNVAFDTGKSVAFYGKTALCYFWDVQRAQLETY